MESITSVSQSISQTTLSPSTKGGTDVASSHSWSYSLWGIDFGGLVSALLLSSSDSFIIADESSLSAVGSVVGFKPAVAALDVINSGQTPLSNVPSSCPLVPYLLQYRTIIL